MDFNYKKKLESHIEALENTYDKIIEILNKDSTKDDKGEITLKDSQFKSFAEGTLKLVESADNIIERIRAKQIELEALNGEPKPKNDDENSDSETEKTKEEVGKVPSGDSDLASRVKG